ncbi:hypothetical protein CTI12_AA199960 [Artemisia annua]|uniref:RRM domain-containing protein n=1 Tax=Artemisia annua TaxID=35608 RepID=A0A2U1P2Z9_ARTAN|nr:hypothetical protein CTI12_AA199960 [Artemisia annua]
MGMRYYKHEDGWTWTFRKRDNQGSRISNPFNNGIEKISESFYITNFPDHLDAKGLWRACEPFGRIVDAYIAKKHSKLGKRFAFVRFLGISKAEDFVKRLSTIWINNHHVFAAVARFKRPSLVQRNFKSQSNIQHAFRKPKPQAVDKGNYQSEASTYASVVNGGAPKHSISHQRDSKKSITLHDSDLIKIDDSSRVLLAKVKDIGTMNNIYHLCTNEGFSNISIHHVGGLCLWFQFLDSEQCIAFKNNFTMNTFFSSIKNVSQNFIVDERMIWIEINGLPLCAWGSSALKKVASLFGKFIFFENDQGTTIGTGRVCIATTQKKFISEEVTVSVNGVDFNVNVHELATWSINIDKVQDYDDETSEKEDGTPSSDFGDLISEGKLEENFIVDERMIWIEINGLPLCAWGSSALKKVASLFGKFIFFENDQGTTIGTGRVCIATTQKSFISEEVTVSVNGVDFNVNVHELAIWSINIDKVQDSDDETSEKEDGTPSSDFGDLISGDKLEEVRHDNHIDNSEENIKKSTESMEHVVKDQSHTSSPILNTSNVNKASTDSEDLSCPPGFEHLKRNISTHPSHSVCSSSAKCSTMFAKYRKKDIKSLSLLHEMNHIIEVGGALGYDVRGCRKTLKGILNESGASFFNK